MSYRSGNNRFQHHQGAFDELWDGELPILKPGNIEQWVQIYVQDVLDRIMPKNRIFTSRETNPQVFETHRSVIIRIKLSHKVPLDLIRIYVAANHVKLQGISNIRSMKIPLPSLVNIQRSKAKYKDGILEIRMPKAKGRGRMREIFIEYP